MGQVDVAGLDPALEARVRLVRSGFRFDDPATERAYRSWYIDHAVPFTRLGMAASISTWLSVFFACGLVDGWQRASAPWIFGVMMPCLVGTYGITYRRSLRQLVLPATAVVNAVAGLVFVWPFGSSITAETLIISNSAAGVAFFALAIFRLHPLMAVSAALTYIVAAQVLLVQQYRDDIITGTTFASASAVPWISLVAGLVANLASQRIARQTFRAELIIEDQTRRVAEERSRADALLHNILPVPIADRLKRSHDVIADDFEHVTVLFADVVGFTPLAATMTPAEVVTLLNGVFTTFDDLVEHFGAEKIKTIGDAYMAVAGIPAPRDDHVAVMADLALAMRDVVIGTRVGLRIGIATGPAVAGVIGTHKFAYDLWGDTVNTAARMEAHGVPGAIQVTEAVRDALAAHGYEFADRGLVELKGKGPTQAYLLEGRRHHLDGADGIGDRREDPLPAQ